MVFFEAQSLAAQEVPYRVVPDRHPACGKLRLQSVQRKVRGLFEPLLNEIAMWQEQPLAVAAHLARRHRTCRPVALHQLHNAGNRNVKTGRRLPAACARQNRSNRTFAKIV
jgi:hypothetical protein